MKDYAYRAVLIAVGHFDGEGTWSEVYDLAMRELGAPQKLCPERKRASKAVVTALCEFTGGD